MWVKVSAARAAAKLLRFSTQEIWVARTRADGSRDIKTEIDSRNIMEVESTGVGDLRGDNKKGNHCYYYNYHYY